MSPPAIRAARHVVLGDAGAAALVRAGAHDVTVLRDLLAMRLRPRLTRWLLLSLGDLVIDVRRHAWRALGALELAEDDPLAARRLLRLTADGARILRVGLERAADAPRLVAGGHDLYGPARGGSVADGSPRGLRDVGLRGAESGSETSRAGHRGRATPRS